MKKTLLLSALALAFMAPAASAITVDDLDGKTCAQIFAGNHSENGLPRVGCSGKFRKINNTTVAVDNFFEDYTVTFTLSNNKLTLNVGSLSNPTQYKPTKGGSGYLVMYNVVGYSSTLTNIYTGAKTTYYRYQPTSARSTFASNAYANLGARGYGFTFDGTSNTASSGACYFALVPNDEDNRGMVFYNFSLIVQDNNGYAIESDGTTYPVNYDIEENTINFLNFYNLGVPYSIDFSGPKMAFSPTISATLNQDGTFTIPAQVIGGAREGRFQGYSPTEVDLGDRGTGNVSGAGWGYTNYPLEEYNFYLCSNNNGKGNITGKAYTGRLNHVANGNYWGSDSKLNGSTLKTYKGEVLSVGNMKIYDDFNGSILKNTSSVLFVRDLNAEITHGVELVKKEYGYDNIGDNNGKYLYINCDLVNARNADYVESYDLYVVPGKYTSVAGKDFASADGHVNGTLIDVEKYSTSFVPDEKDHLNTKSVASNPDGNVNFTVLVPEKELNATDANGVYSVYVRANYKEESGLEPTFHALTALGEKTTGVESVITNGNEDEDAPVVYFNMNGIQVSGDALTPGLYIRRQGNTATKVLVK